MYVLCKIKVSMNDKSQGVDLIPPGRIVDLALVSVSTVQNNVKVSLRFTEPGDDNFDNGGEHKHLLTISKHSW